MLSGFRVSHADGIALRTQQSTAERSNLIQSEFSAKTVSNSPRFSLLSRPPSTQLLGSLKLLAAALRHKPGSPAAAEALSAPRVENVLRGLAAAIQRDVSKPKRRVEILKAAAASVEALARVSAGSGGQLPQAGVRAVQQALAAAAAAAAAGAAGAGEEPVAGAGKLKGQFTRIEGALNRAAAGGGGGGAGTGGKKDKKRKEAPAAAAGAGAASVAGAAGAAGKKKKVDKSAASGGKKKSKKQE